ncbi:protein mono-ADP-ribosyltransferase PARP14 [Polymixia lowei]
MAGRALILEGLPGDLDRVKPRLELYFRNKRRSGAEILELQEDPTDKRKALLVYLDEADLQKVFSKRNHRVDFKEPFGLVELQVKLQPVSTCQAGVEKVCSRKVHEHERSVVVCGESAAEGQLDPRRFVLSGFDDGCIYSLVSVYLDSCSREAEHAWDTLDDGDRIVVTFMQDIDVNHFMKNCSTKTFQDKEVRASRLELTDSVLVQGDTSQISEEVLMLYFSNKRSKGGEIKSLVSRNTSIVITFNERHVAHRVADHTHTLSGKLLVAQLFYSNLQKSLPGQTHLQQNITHITIPVTKDLLSFMSLNEVHKQELTSVLEKAHASVSLKMDDEPPQMELNMSVDKRTLGALRHGRPWESSARREAQAQLGRYAVDHLPADAEVWEEIKDSCLELNTANAHSSFKIGTSEIVVVGVRVEVVALVEKVKNMVKKASDDLQIKRDTIEKQIQLDSREKLGLIWDLVSDKLIDVVTISKEDESFTLYLKGLKNKVDTAEEIIKEAQDIVVAQKLDLSPCLTKFLKSLDLKKFQSDHFTQNNITAVLLFSDDSFHVIADKADIHRAEDKLHEVIKGEVIELSPEEVNVTKGDQWEQFLAALKGDLESTQNHQSVTITLSGEKIEVCGCCTVVADVLSKVREHLEDKKPVTVDVPLKSVQELTFIKTCMKLSEDRGLKALGATALPGKTSASPCLKVTATNDKIKQATDAVTLRISTITTEKHVYSRAGEAKVLQKNTLILMAKAKLLDCDLQLSEPTTITAKLKSENEGLGSCQTAVVNTSGPPPSHSASPPPVPPKNVSNTKVIGGVSVILKKGDITKETVDVIVNSNNQNLNLNSGVSGAILQAAGQSVVDECKKHGAQKAGGVVLSGGGNLSCKHIAQMVGPSSAAGITAAIQKVLQLCESKTAATVAIPSIGTGRGGISPMDSVKAILEAVKNHTSQTSSTSLTKIFIVAFEDRVFASMKNVINKSSQPQRSGLIQVHGKATAPQISTKPDLPPNQVKIQGVMIEVKRGDITIETVRGIVNTTNADVNLTGGVSGAIIRAAGPVVEQECERIRPLKGHGVGVTSGGALQCDFILHMLGPHSAADGTARVIKVLERCEENSISTVSVPAVGTGGGGLSGSDSCGAILQGIKEHLSHCASTVLKLIYVIVDQDNILQGFQQGLNQWKSNHKVSNDKEDDSDEDDDSSIQSSSSEEEDDTTGQTPTSSEVVIGPMKVKVLCGDITKETTDAIVSSTNTSLNLSSGVSGAVLKAAGQTVVDECSTLGTQPSDGVVITKPGNLPTKHIIHMVGQTKEKDITNSMLKALKMCEDHKIQSVSFPALGTGAGNLGALQVGNAMITAIEELLIFNQKRPSLTTIHIVIFQTNMMQQFQEVIKRFKNPTPRPAAARKIHKPRKSGLTPNTSTKPTQQPTLCLAGACRGMSFLTVEAEVFGFSAASLAQVKKIMDDCVSEECHSEDVTSSQLPRLLEPEKQAIVDLSQKNQVCVLVSAQDKATISGKKDDVLATVLQIQNFLQKAKERESREGEEKRLRDTLQWEVGEGETWADLNQSISLDLEQAFHDKRQSISYDHQGETYTVDLKSMQRVDRKGTITRVKRTLKADSDTAVIQPPPSWTRMDNKDMDIVDLTPTSAEYKKIETEFIKSSKNPKHTNHPTINVVKIQRIQNRYQWQRYAVKKQVLDKKYPTNKNEINIYHGTTADICQKINTNGFNRSFCGRNATAYGNGTYFAKESWYSCHDTYSNPDTSGVKYMYRARVLVGKPCLGKPGMKEPEPLTPGDPGAGLYDCAVDHPRHPFIYVVFCDAGAYPDYLISFKTS